MKTILRVLGYLLVLLIALAAVLLAPGHNHKEH